MEKMSVQMPQGAYECPRCGRQHDEHDASACAAMQPMAATQLSCAKCGGPHSEFECSMKDGADSIKPGAADGDAASLNQK